MSAPLPPEYEGLIHVNGGAVPRPAHHPRGGVGGEGPSLDILEARGHQQVEGFLRVLPPEDDLQGQLTVLRDLPHHQHLLHVVTTEVRAWQNTLTSPLHGR